MTESSTRVIETHGLRKQFGRNLAVADLSLQVDRGEVFGFLGPNGAGKTTSLKLLLGLVEPNGLPSELTHTTCQRRVSMGRPSPIMVSHQPSVASSTDDAACADGERPVKSSTVLSSFALRVPQLS